MIAESRDGTGSIRYAFTGCGLQMVTDEMAAARCRRTTLQSDGVDAANERACSMQIIMKRRANVDLPDAASPITSTGRPCRSSAVISSITVVKASVCSVAPSTCRDRAEIVPRSCRDRPETEPRSRRDRAEARAHERLQPDALAHDVEALAREGIDNEGVVRAYPADVPAAMRLRLDAAAWSVFCNLCGSSVNCNLSSIICHL